MPSPRTSYAKSGDVNIAYQVLGEGPIDLVYVWGWLSHLDFQWTDPTIASFLRRLASFCRLIMFDKRGVGLSDPVGSAPTFARSAPGLARASARVLRRRSTG
jgi:pimeloyl-ACP methyl ester carboxylesterase